MDDGKHKGFPQRTVTIVDPGYALAGGDIKVTRLDAIEEALKIVTSLPQGPERHARVQRLSVSKVLDLLDDCEARLAQLGLSMTYHQETDPE